MKFIKHVGKHQNRRVAIIYRVVPDEEHMCLVIYPDNIPTAIHDSIMKVIESDPGQQATNLSDVLFRSLLNDGRPILETLHKEGLIKKVPTNQIVVTPNVQSHVRLDELNKILNDLEAGDDAASKMQKLDEGAGLVDPQRPQPARKIGEDQSHDDLINAPPPVLDLSDEGLANQRIAQSAKMAQEAQQLLAESQRLQEEAWDLNPALKPVVKKETPVKDALVELTEEQKAPVKKKAVRKKATRKKAVRKKAPAKKATTEAGTTPVTSE